MSTSMLLKSDVITVLLWGDRWWLPLHKLPVPFAEIGQAADMLAAAWPAKVRRLRLIYQPDDFVSAAVACPNGVRAALALALADKHPELAHPGHAWGFETIRAVGEGFCTLLHYETRPQLFALAQRLEERGFTVESAWSLPTWLATLAPEPISGGAVSVAALHADRFAFYQRGADGAPDGIQAVGLSVSSVAERLRGALAINAPEYLLHLTTDDALLAQLEEQIPAAQNRQDGVFHLWDALAKPFPLALQHPAQLLPLIPRFAPRRIAALAGFLFFGLTVWTAGLWAYERHQWEKGRETQAKEEAELSRQIAERESIKAKVAAAQVEIDALTPRSHDYAGILAELGRSRPDGLVYSRIQCEGTKLNIDGWARAGVDAQQLAARPLVVGASWTKPEVRPNGHFRIAGELRSP